MKTFTTFAEAMEDSLVRTIYELIQTEGENMQEDKRWKRQPTEDTAKKHGYKFHRNATYSTLGRDARRGKGKVYLHKGTGHLLTTFDDNSWEHQPTAESGLRKTNSRLTPDLDAHLKNIHS